MQGKTWSLPVPRDARWYILAGHGLLLILLYFSHGIALDKEAEKYIGCARDLLHGDASDLFGNYLKHAAYVLFLVPFIAIDMPQLVVPVQAVLMVMAAAALARISERLTANEGIGTVAFGIFLLCPIVQVWTLTAYTEAFYTALSVLFLDVATRSVGRPAVLVPLAVMTLFSRPVGLFMVGVTGVWFATRPLGPKLRLWIRMASCTTLLLIAILIPGIRQAQLLPIARGEVIAGRNGLVQVDHVEGSRIIDAHKTLLRHVAPLEWMELTWRRASALFQLTRPWYSARHTGLNMVYYLLYPLALMGLWRYRHDSSAWLIFSLVVMNAGLVALTHAEWNGRFLVPLLPLVIVLASAGLPHVSGGHRPPGLE